MEKQTYQRSMSNTWLTSRFLTVLCGVSVIANIILISAFLSFFPIKKTQPYFIQIDNLEDKVVYLNQDYKMPPEQSNFIKETFIKKYILQREQFSDNLLKNISLWGNDSFVYYASSEKVYKDFLQTNIYNDVITQKNPKRIARIVEIKEITALPTGEYSVSGFITDYKLTGIATNKNEPFNITVSSDILSEDKMYLPYKDRLKNPFGFVINDYEVKRIGNY